MRLALEVSFIAKNFGSVYIVKKSKNFCELLLPAEGVFFMQKVRRMALFCGIFSIFFLT